MLLQCQVDVHSRDSDGWTPLHAAAHWGQEEACNVLVEHMCDMSAVNIVVSGQTHSHMFYRNDYNSTYSHHLMILFVTYKMTVC